MGKRRDACCGALTGIDYSDATPDVTFTHDRLGRQKTITDVLGTRRFTYDDQLRLAAETNALAVLTRSYDALGRDAGFGLAYPADPSEAFYSVTYGHDNLGRFASLASSAQSAQSVARYSYLPGTDLLAGWDLDLGNGVTNRTRRTYEPHRNLIASVSNTVFHPSTGWSLISAFDYTNDQLARRTGRTDHRSPVTDHPITTNLFGYNPRSEVSSAQMGTNAYAYLFDPIGNRRQASRLEAAAAVTNLYASNPLNQYTNLLTSAPPAPLRETPVFHDSDGNLTNDGARAYFWDAENRLIAVAPVAPTVGDPVVSYAYDFMSRRVARNLYSWLGPNSLELQSEQRFVFDGWNAIADVAGGPGATPAATNLYVWGLDLSGALQGAGGIGGLLASTRLPASQPDSLAAFCFDANGNVTDLVDTKATLVAHYEFDPFGRTVVAEGPEAAENPFRFSTKHWDDSTGLGYWGYRWLEPETGRWLSRDPIGEHGGPNLSAMVRNCPTTRVDPWGLRISGPDRIVAKDKSYQDVAANREQYKAESICDWTVSGKIAKSSASRVGRSRQVTVYATAESETENDSSLTAIYNDGTVDTKTVTVIRPSYLKRVLSPDREQSANWVRIDGTVITIYDQFDKLFPQGVAVSEKVSVEVVNFYKWKVILGSAKTSTKGAVTDSFGAHLVYNKIDGEIADALLKVDQTIIVGVNWEAKVTTELHSAEKPNPDFPRSGGLGFRESWLTGTTEAYFE